MSLLKTEISNKLQQQIEQYAVYHRVSFDEAVLELLKDGIIFNAYYVRERE